MRRLSKDSEFSEKCNSATEYLREGRNFFEIRQLLGIDSNYEWSDLRYVAIKRCFNPESAAMNCIKSTEEHVALAKKHYDCLVQKENPNADQISRALLTLSTLEQRKFEVLRELGMLKQPVEIDGGEGYDSNEVIDVENEMKEKIEQRLIRHIEASRRLSEQESLPLLTRNEPERPADIVVEASLAGKNS